MDLVWPHVDEWLMINEHRRFVDIVVVLLGNGPIKRFFESGKIWSAPFFLLKGTVPTPYSPCVFASLPVSALPSQLHVSIHGHPKPFPPFPVLTLARQVNGFFPLPSTLSLCAGEDRSCLGRSYTSRKGCGSEMALLCLFGVPGSCLFLRNCVSASEQRCGLIGRISHVPWNCAVLYRNFMFCREIKTSH